MNNETTAFDQTDEQVLIDTISDEALEALSGADRARWTGTDVRTDFGPCTC